MHKLLSKSVVLAAALSLTFFLALSKPTAANSRAIVIQAQGQSGQQGDQNNKDDHGKKDQKEDINDDRQDGPNDNLQEGPNDERNDDREMDKTEGQNAKGEVADSKHESMDLKHAAVFGHKHDAENGNYKGTARETAAGGKTEKVDETDVDNDRVEDQQQDREQDEQQGSSEPPSGS